MAFWNRDRKRSKVGPSGIGTLQQPLLSQPLPQCYDVFRGTKIYNIIEHPMPEGDRIYMIVPYACSPAAKELGARWDPEAKRWWHWSNSTAQLACDGDPDRWVSLLLDAHAQSTFAQWPVDSDFMCSEKYDRLGLPDTFDYCNPCA